MDILITYERNEFNPYRFCEIAQLREAFEFYEVCFDWICLHVRPDEFWSDDDEDRV